MKESHDYHCSCGKLLCKGAIFDGEIQIKCKRCGKIQTIEDLTVLKEDFHSAEHILPKKI